MMPCFLHKLAVFALFFGSATVVSAQQLQLQWAKALTGTAAVSAFKITVDAQANLYVVGAFSGTADFDPGPGTASLTSDTSFGLGAYYLAKYDAQGAFVFVRQMPTLPVIALDNSSNIWLAGSFSGTRDFDPGAGAAPLSSAGSSDIFVAKYNSSGTYLSAFRLGASGSDAVEGITVDAAGNVYITGSFRQTVDFDPGAGAQALTSLGTVDAFLAKYSASGAFVFAFNLPGTGTVAEEEGVGIAVNAAGDIYLGGRFQGTIDLDPGAGTAQFSSAGVDGFIAKYSSSGAYISGFNINGNLYNIELDAASNLWVTGTTPDSSDMDPGPGIALLYSVNNFDVYIARYTAALGYGHARAFQSNSIYLPDGLAVNHQAAAYLCGRFPDTANFNPGGSGGTFISQGGTDGFVMKYDASNAYVLGSTFGSTGGDRGTGLAVDQQGSVWICGPFAGTVDFDPGTGTTTLTSTPSPGGYIARYTDPTATTAVLQPASRGMVKIFGADRSVIVDFTALDAVDAQVRVMSLLGQPIATARHTRADMLRLHLPDVAVGTYVVTVNNRGAMTTQKVWVR